MPGLASLDARTLLFVVAAVSFLTSASLGIAVAITPQKRDLSLWAVGFVLISASSVLIWARDAAPDFVSIPFANTLGVAGCLIFLRGLNHFLALSTSVWPSVAVVAGTFVHLMYFTYVEPSLTQRIVWISLVLGATGVLASWRLTTRVSPGMRRIQVFIAALMAIHAALMAVRIVATLTTTVGSDLFEANLITTVSALDFALFFPCVGMGLLSMVYKRLSLELMTEVGLRRQSETDLTATMRDLEKTLREMKTLKGIIPICSSCKKIRDDRGTWEQLELYLRTHSDAEFSHGLCPDCTKRLYPELSE